MGVPGLLALVPQRHKPVPNPEPEEVITLPAVKHRSRFGPIQVQALQAQVIFGKLYLPLVWSLCLESS